VTVLRLRGVVLPDDQERTLYVDGDRITLDPVAVSETVVDGGRLVPGLVDVHTHPGADLPGDPFDEVLLRRGGATHREAGVTLLRAPGLAAHPDMPRLQAAGPWLAPTGGFFPDCGRHLDVGDLAAAAEANVRAGLPWVKVVVDWSSTGADGTRRYLPTVDADVLADLGRPGPPCGRTGRRAQPARRRGGRRGGLAGARHALVHRGPARMAARGTALVPTLRAFSAVRPGDDPVAAFMRAGRERHPALVVAAHEAGVPVRRHRRPAPRQRRRGDHAAPSRGPAAAAALAAGSWAARAFLGLPGLAEGAPADIVDYPRDPRTDLTVLHEPARVVLKGRVVR
jgi:imidazolonepropionase-like amidohydrolase